MGIKWKDLKEYLKHIQILSKYKHQPIEYWDKRECFFSIEKCWKCSNIWFSLYNSFHLPIQTIYICIVHMYIHLYTIHHIMKKCIVEYSFPQTCNFSYYLKRPLMLIEYV